MEKKNGFSYMKVLDLLAGGLLFIGGINWALVGIFDFNLVESIFGSVGYLTRVIYVLVGVAALYDLFMWGSIQRRWECTGFFGRAEVKAA